MSLTRISWAGRGRGWLGTLGTVGTVILLRAGTRSLTSSAALRAGG